MRADARLALVVAAAGAAAAMALAAPTLPVPVRAVGAGALALALPGAAIVAALMPRVRWRRSERLALALGGSLTVAIAAAFVLHASPTGLTASAWAGLLGGVAVVGGIVGCLRALREPASGVPPTQLVPDGGAVASAVDRSAALSPWAAAMLVASGLLVMVALVMARSGVALGPEPRFAELWLLPAEGDRAVRVGVANHEGTDATYRLVVTVDGRRLGDPLEVEVADGGTADRTVELPGRAAGDRVVEVRMWHADAAAGDEPLRSVRATVASAGTP